MVQSHYILGSHTSGTVLGATDNFTITTRSLLAAAELAPLPRATVTLNHWENESLVV